MIGIIHTIFSGVPKGIFQSYLKTDTERTPLGKVHHKRFHQDEVITFLEADEVTNYMFHSNVLVIKMIATEKEF